MSLGRLKAQSRSDCHSDTFEIARQQFAVIDKCGVNIPVPKVKTAAN
jgi:hypothetical protein